MTADEQMIAQPYGGALYLHLRQDQESFVEAGTAPAHPFPMYDDLIIIFKYLMSKKNATSKQEPQSNSLPISSLPHTFRLKNLTNHSDPPEITSLRLRIDELESKVGQLEARIKSKRKRIRRKSSEVEKKYKCDFCKKLYGSLVSLNLHLRIKHKKQKQEKEGIDSTDPKGKVQDPAK